MSTSSHILIVDDDLYMARAIERHLLREGYLVTIATNGVELNRSLSKDGADLVLLDLNLGNEDGLSLAREMASSTAAIVIITVRQEVQDCIEALDAGADDYVTKPFDMDELLARVRAVLRRRSSIMHMSGPIQLGALMLDPDSAVLTDTERRVCVRLTETEARILAMLMRHHSRALSRANLLNRETLGPDDRSLDVHVANIRRKLRAASIDAIVIWPLRGYGYRLRLEPSSSD